MYSWDECLFLEGKDEIRKHFSNRTSKKTLLIMGLGFDPRSCRFTEFMIEDIESLTICAIDYHDESVLEDQRKELFSMNNWEKLHSLCKNNELIRKEIPMYIMDETKKTLLVSENVRTVMNKAIINGFDNLVIDISAMPRGLSFSIIKRLIEIHDPSQKIYITVCENSKYDDSIKPKITEESAEFLLGFNTFSLNLEQEESDTIWFPLLGMDSIEALRITSDFLKPIEICPVVPFPSIDVRRGEKMIRSCGEVLFRERNVERRNIIYIPETDPRLVCQKLYETVKYYEKAFKIDKERIIKYAFSSESSKLMDVGMLLAILKLNEENIKTGIVVVEHQGYEPIDDYNVIDERLYCLCLNDNIFEW